MRGSRFELSSTFEVPVGSLWRFHLQPEALALLTPPLMHLEVEDAGQGVRDGSLVSLRIGRGRLGARWQALHCGVVAGESFTDVALQSPFPYWVHVHGFRAAGRTRSELCDVVWYVPPRWLPRVVAEPLTRLALRLLFGWRHRRTRSLLRGQRPAARRSPSGAAWGDRIEGHRAA